MNTMTNPDIRARIMISFNKFYHISNYSKMMAILMKQIEAFHSQDNLTCSLPTIKKLRKRSPLIKTKRCVVIDFYLEALVVIF